MTLTKSPPRNAGEGRGEAGDGGAPPVGEA
jgi:hypothetical protein